MAQAAGNGEMALNVNIIEKLGELVSKEDRKSIPVYNGNGSGTSLFDWLRDAERIARNNDWSDSQKIRFFGDRLRGDAADWHSDFLESHPQTNNYTEWKKSLIETFEDENDKEKLKQRLHNLKQKPEQKIKYFAS